MLLPAKHQPVLDAPQPPEARGSDLDGDGLGDAARVLGQLGEAHFDRLARGARSCVGLLGVGVLGQAWRDVAGSAVDSDALGDAAPWSR